jgi:RNA polymerase sigma-70 factor (ECF subfamily)
VGANVTYVEVPGGDHSSVVEPTFRPCSRLFDTLSKRQPDGHNPTTKPRGATGIPSLCAIPLYLTPRLEAAPDSTVDPVVRAAQAGDAEAFASLYDAHVSRVYALCLGLAGNREEAAELCRIRLCGRGSGCTRSAASVRFPPGCIGWRCTSRWRHGAACVVVRCASRSRRLASPAGGDVLERDAPAPSADVALVMDLETAISRLPAGARAVFVLYDIGGYSHAEIAERLQIAEGTSKAHLFRARRLLRGMLDR